MADVAMCNNEDCRLRQQCYRYRAVPSQYQAYAPFHLTKEPDGREVCEFYMFLHTGAVVLENGKPETI